MATAKLAQSMKMNVSDFLEKVNFKFSDITMKEGGERAGWTEVHSDGTFDVYVTSLLDQTTGIHEMGHVYLSMLGDGYKSIEGFEQAFSNELNKDGGRVGRNTQEAFSEALESYVNGAAAKSEGLRKVFNLVLDALRNFVNSVRDLLSPEKAAMFDNLFEKGLKDFVQEEPTYNEETFFAKDADTEDFGGVGNNGYRTETDNGVIYKQGDEYGKKIREGQLHEGRTGEDVYAQERGDGFSTYIKFDGLPERAFSQGNDSDRSIRQVRFVRVIKSINEDADYVAIPKLEKTRDNILKFHSAIEKARQTQKYGLYVSLYPIDDVDRGEWIENGYSNKDIDLYLSEDGSTGFALHGTDIVSVFTDKTVANHPMAVCSILLNALEAGGNKLDCYGHKLVRFYEQMGFVLDGKIRYNDKYETEDWTSRKDVLGSPDVFALHWGDTSIDETISKLSDRLKTITETSVIEECDNIDYLILENQDDEYDALITLRDSKLAEKDNGETYFSKNASKDDTIRKYTDKSRYSKENIYGDVYVDNARVEESRKSGHEEKNFKKELEAAKRFSEYFNCEVFMLPPRESNSVIYVAKHSNPDAIVGWSFIDFKENFSGNENSIKSLFSKATKQADSLYLTLSGGTSIEQAVKWINGKSGNVRRQA